MGLSKDTIAWIASLAGLSAEDITAKIASEKEEEIKKPQGTLYTDSDIEGRESLKYTEGKTAASEMLAKSIKKENGYEIETKDINEVLKHHASQLKTKYSANESARVSDLESSLETQKKTYETEITNLKDAATRTSAEILEANTRVTLMGSIPEGLTLNAEDAITLFNSKYKVTNSENDGIVVTRDGKILRDEKSAKPLEIKNVFSTFVNEGGYVKSKGGRGGSNEGGSGGSSEYTAKSPEEFQRQWQSKNEGVSTASPQYDQDYAAWRKSGEKA